MTLEEPWITRVEIAIGSQRLGLCFDFGALATAERHLKGRGVEVCLLDGLPTLNFSASRILFAASLDHFHPHIDFADALNFVRVDNLAAVVSRVREAWTQSFPAVVSKPARKRRQTIRTGSQRKLAVVNSAQRWREIEAVARVNLRMGWGELQRITPAHWLTLMEALERKRELQGAIPEFMMAQLTAAVINFSMARPAKPIDVRMLMPSLAAQQRKPRTAIRKKQTDNQQAAVWRSFMGDHRKFSGQ